MTERPLCRDVSLAAARECLVDAASYADVGRRAHEAMAQRDALLERAPAPESVCVCVCGDYPVTVGEPCAACAVEAEMDAERAEVGA
jgi:hypothetical protein